MITNNSVVLTIRFILAEAFKCFGYEKITADLRSNGFIINRKKVYHLMKEHRLLCGRVIKAQSGKRRFVQWRVQQAFKPIEQLCTDIKYVHIPWRRPKCPAAYSAGCIYPQHCNGQVLWWWMCKENVIWLLHQILQQHQVRSLTLRNDNGSQFIAFAVQEYLQEKEVVQKFIHVATPPENSFIEAYHSILQGELLDPGSLKI